MSARLRSDGGPDKPRIGLRTVERRLRQFPVDTLVRPSSDKTGQQLGVNNAPGLQ